MNTVTHRFRAGLGVLALAVVAVTAGCNRDRIAKTGRVTHTQLEDYVRDAVRMSSEGVVLEPSGNGIGDIERVRFGEIAQQLRRPAAVCFVERAIQTMEPGEVDGEAGWVEIPEGQIKIRTRVAVSGEVLSTVVLDSGFEDEDMEACLREVLTEQRFPESRDSFAYHVDVYYWVSLGFFREANTEAFTELMRRQQAEAGVRAKGCLSGRLPAGEYRVRGLNLFGRDGHTIINRIDRGQLPENVSRCVAQAFKGIRIYAEPEAFVRPAAPVVEFEIDQEGVVTVVDERWLELIQLEERAERERKQAELMGRTPGAVVEDDSLEVAPDLVDGGGSVPSGLVLGPDDVDGDPDAGPAPAPESEPDPESKPQPETDPAQDPSKAGVKIDLSPSRGR